VTAYQRRRERAERLFDRAIARFRVEEAMLIRADGGMLRIEAYRGRPQYTESTGLGVRASAVENWTVSASTFRAIQDFVGGDGFFGGTEIRSGTERFRVDNLVPFVAVGLRAGYTIQTTRIGGTVEAV